MTRSIIFCTRVTFVEFSRHFKYLCGIHPFVRKAYQTYIYIISIKYDVSLLHISWSNTCCENIEQFSDRRMYLTKTETFKFLWNNLAHAVTLARVVFYCYIISYYGMGILKPCSCLTRQTANISARFSWFVVYCHQIAGVWFTF